MIAGKTLLDYTEFFSRNDYKRNQTKIIFMTKQNLSLDFKLKNIEEKNYFLERIKQKDLKGKKHRKFTQL